MKISCLYTTAREHLAEKVKRRFMTEAHDPSEIEWCQTLASEGYDTCVKGWNAAYAKSTGDILVQISDDLYPPKHWDAHIKDMLKNRTNTVLSLLDERAEHAPNCVFHPVMTRDVADKNGFFYPPEYESVYCDNWLAAYAKKHCNFMVGIGKFWTHRHRTTHKVEVDDVMKKHESKERYERGRETFMKHLKEMGYDIT